jgi:hypothetical protein
MKSSTFWDVTSCSPLRPTDVSQENVVSIFRVKEYAKRKACVNPLLLHLLHAGVFLGLFFDTEDGGYVFHKNFG